MEMLGKVRRMHYRDRLSRSEIARRTGLSRTTVRKWLEEAEAVTPRYRRSKTPGKLTAFEATVVGWLESDARRPKRERRTAQAMLTQLKAQGFEGGYTILTDFIRDWRHRKGTKDPGRAFVPLKFELGEAFAVRLERGAAGHRWGVAQAAGGAPEAVCEPRVRAGGLPESSPRDAVRRAHAQFRGTRRHCPARHL